MDRFEEIFLKTGAIRGTENLKIEDAATEEDYPRIEEFAAGLVRTQKALNPMA